jgi:RNase P/RNase MRP subunit p30
MKRAFADIHLCPNIDDSKQVVELVKKAHVLGYQLAGIVLPLTASTNKIEELRSLCKEQDVDFASRVDLRPKSVSQLKHDLRRLRRKYEILAVFCENKNVARQAAKDRRVDVLNFPFPDFRRCFFDQAEAELAASALASLEIDMKQLLTLDGSARARLLSILRREAEIAKKLHVPIIVSSGVSDPMLLRRPMETAAITSLFGLDQTTALDTISKNPNAMVKRNRVKLDQKFVAPGIRVIRRGEDC